MDVTLILTVGRCVLRATPFLLLRKVTIRRRITPTKEAKAMYGRRITSKRRVGLQVNCVTFVRTHRKLLLARFRQVKYGTTAMIRKLSIVIRNCVGVPIAIRRRTSSIVNVLRVPFVLYTIRYPLSNVRIPFSGDRRPFHVVMASMLLIALHRRQVVARCNDISKDLTMSFPRFRRVHFKGSANDALYARYRQGSAGPPGGWCGCCGG